MRPPAHSKPSQSNNSPTKSGRLNNEQSRQLQQYHEQQERSQELPTDGSSPPRSFNATPSYTTTSVQSTLHQTEIVQASDPSPAPKAPASSNANTANQANYISKYGKQYMRDQALVA